VALGYVVVTLHPISLGEKEGTMKSASLIVALVVALSVTNAIAGDGHVAKSTLSKMGFGSMRVISDAQGMQTRGMGTVVVVGTGGAAVTVLPGFVVVSAGGTDGYGPIVSSTDYAFAAGGRLSFAQNATTLFGGGSISASSGGSAFGFAK
jgi:hypothetical protein